MFGGAFSGLNKRGAWDMPPVDGIGGPMASRAVQPRSLGFGDKLGIVGDILSGNNATQQRLMAQQQASMPRYQQVGDSLLTIDPVTGQPTVAFDGRKPAAPHYWETNNGSLASVGPDGMPKIVYEDPTPKQGVVAIDNADGTKTLYPTVNGVPVGMTPGASAPGAGTIPLQNGALPPGFKLRSGGAAPSGQRPFP